MSKGSCKTAYFRCPRVGNTKSKLTDVEFQLYYSILSILLGTNYVSIDDGFELLLTCAYYSEFEVMRKLSGSRGAHC